jgi:hypothetical protein
MSRVHSRILPALLFSMVVFAFGAQDLQAKIPLFSTSTSK